MRLKTEQQIKPPELLVAEFISLLDNKCLISNLTGSIFSSPVIIKGSSEPQERGFIENAIKMNGKNPLTKDPMTLEELAKIPNDENIVVDIKNSIEKFLEENVSHPELDKVKELLSEAIYKHETLEINTRDQGSANASVDDILAIHQAQRYQPALTLQLNANSHVSQLFTFFRESPLPTGVSNLVLLGHNNLRPPKGRRL